MTKGEVVLTIPNAHRSDIGVGLLSVILPPSRHFSEAIGNAREAHLRGSGDSETAISLYPNLGNPDRPVSCGSWRSQCPYLLSVFADRHFSTFQVPPPAPFQPIANEPLIRFDSVVYLIWPGHSPVQARRQAAEPAWRTEPANRTRDRHPFRVTPEGTRTSLTKK